MIDMKETLGNIVENVMDGIKKEKKIDKTKEFAELLVKCDLTTFLAMSKILCIPIKDEEQKICGRSKNYGVKLLINLTL